MLIDALAEKLNTKIQEWKPDTVDRVRQLPDETMHRIKQAISSALDLKPSS